MVQSCRDHLTARLRDRSLPDQERREAELQWVAFSSCLELFHADMCKVYHMGNTFSVANYSYMVWTGMQADCLCAGGTSEIAARALSLPELQEDAGEEDLEQTQLEEDIAHVDRTLQDMEQKVNVLHWTVEAQGPLYAEPLSSDSTSSALLSVDEEAPGGLCNHTHLSAVLLLCGVAAMAVALSVSVALLA
ncbi:regulator of G-protein signaling 9-binding protein isoform X1 [Electrophorus electricus]|uniref:regulator of G-protein signaling 9-binding protein isoform X1 n=1 Tax=Electrophorus electricus TaxID=8005 RepID=UPI0015CF8791|nr:regulator of G-protein signaling 9-binding protein isoform X1 [Electrophorus electricus]